MAVTTRPWLWPLSAYTVILSLSLSQRPCQSIYGSPWGLSYMNSELARPPPLLLILCPGPSVLWLLPGRPSTAFWLAWLSTLLRLTDDLFPFSSNTELLGKEVLKISAMFCSCQYAIIVLSTDEGKMLPDHIVFLFWLCGMWDLSSLTRKWTHAPCIGKRES